MSGPARTHVKTWVLLVLMVTFGPLGDIFLGKGMRQLGGSPELRPAQLVHFFVRAFESPLVWLGIASLWIAALGFIGLGIPLPNTDWGDMLNTGVTFANDGYWWEIVPAAICIILVVIALNYIGDALRDAFEVRLQKR